MFQLLSSSDRIVLRIDWRNLDVTCLLLNIYTGAAAHRSGTSANRRRLTVESKSSNVEMGALATL